MATTTDNLFEAALALSELDRAELVGRLLETLDTETEEGVEAAWVREIDTRVKELETGEVKTVPWEAVRSRLHRTASV
jgi:putative addiction module component (TIGR02574 family)